MSKNHKEERKEKVRAEQSRKASKAKAKARREAKKTKAAGGICLVCKEPLDPALRLPNLKNAADPGNWALIPGPNFAKTQKKVPVHAGCVNRQPMSQEAL